VAGDVQRFLEDAAHFPGGHARDVVFPRTTEEVAEAVAGHSTILPIGAQSSLTGGATPMGETLLSTAKLDRTLTETDSTITVEAGVTVAALQEHLAQRRAWFPPAPTFTGATVGGIVSTNAAGAATFKYGTTREWVQALAIVLADGSVFRIRRGEDRARNGIFDFSTPWARYRISVPTYEMPNVPKRSAGYYATPGMDLIDLFIGSEGTLGVITEVTFRVLSPAPTSALALIPCISEEQALAVAGALRGASIATFRTGDPAGVQVAAIEDMDRRSIEILKEDGADAKNHVAFPAKTAVALLAQVELPDAPDAAEAYEQIARHRAVDAPDAPLVRLCRMLDDLNVLEATELALPGDRRRAEQLVAIREAVPAGVNARVGAAKRDIDARIAKTAADMIVPFAHFGEMMTAYRRGFESRGLDYAIWGHISDGNVHPNVIPRSYADVERGREAILEFGRECARLGGCPLAEHGVGRSPIKQELLRQLYGEEGIDEMRAVKRALDPQWKLAPGVIFERGLHTRMNTDERG
jgi:D-lactate dehydrogenase (cytochrome)